MNTKEKGNKGIAHAIAYFTEIGGKVSIPITDSQHYDLIVDLDGKLQTVQVKWSAGNSIYLRSISGTTRKQYSSVQASAVDLLFAVANNQFYLIPVTELTARSQIRLPDKWKVGRVEMSLLAKQ